MYLKIYVTADIRTCVYPCSMGIRIVHSCCFILSLIDFPLNEKVRKWLIYILYIHTYVHTFVTTDLQAVNPCVESLYLRTVVLDGLEMNENLKGLAEFNMPLFMQFVVIQ